jgi:RES domain-containing protein
MKTIWRISAFADLSGKGAKIASARWHTKGNPVVYLAENPAGAMLEHLVHLFYTRWRLPETYDLLRVQYPERIGITELLPLADVQWKEDLPRTRQIGDEWLKKNETPLARVPSAIMPYTWNFLLNPAHPDAPQVLVAEVHRERFDNRLFRSDPSSSPHAHRPTLIDAP